MQKRDHLASLLTEANATIPELFDRVAELELMLPSSNVVPLGGAEERSDVSICFLRLIKLSAR
ncbi:hypothetical protein [Pseudomonas mucidolens]|nr:hypothetical protein [Pseudomonas mucidolens]